MHIASADRSNELFTITVTKGKSYKHGASFVSLAVSDVSFLQSGVVHIRHDEELGLSEKFFNVSKTEAVFSAFTLVAGIPIKS